MVSINHKVNNYALKELSNYANPFFRELAFGES